MVDGIFINDETTFGTHGFAPFTVSFQLTATFGTDGLFGSRVLVGFVLCFRGSGRGL